MNRRQIILLALGLTLVGGLTYLFTQTAFIQEAVAPFIYIFFLALTDILASLPQLLIWLIFMLVVLQLLANNLLRSFTDWLTKRENAEPEPEEELLGSVEKYMRWVEQEPQGPYFKWRLRQRVMQLTLTALGRGDTVALPQLERNLRDGEYDLPKAVSKYFQDGIKAREGSKQSRLDTLLQPSLSKRDIDKSELNKTLAFIEQSLEIVPPDSADE